MGWAIVDRCADETLRLRASGVIKTKPKTPQPQTLLILAHALDDLIARYDPDEISIEDLFFSNNARSAMIVGQARGMILLAGAQHGLNVVSYTPQQLKIAACGKGRADKQEVQTGIQQRLGLPSPITNEHTADAAAAALRHFDQLAADG